MRWGWLIMTRERDKEDKWGIIIKQVRLGSKFKIHTGRMCIS